MNQYQSGYTGAVDHASAQPVAYADTPTRLAFLRKVYAIFGASMVIWMGTTFAIANSRSLMEAILPLVSGGIFMLIILMALMFLLIRLTVNSFPMNVVGLGLFAVFEGVLTAPLVYMALAQSNETAMLALTNGAVVDSIFENGGGIVTQAFVITTAVFTGLTTYALTTKRDFLWLRGALYMGFFALFAISLLQFFGIGGSAMGWGVSLGFVVVMGGFVLYDTQNILRNYPENMAAAAAAKLLINFVIMFQHILMLLMRRN